MNADRIGHATTKERGSGIHPSISEDAKWVEKVLER